MADRTKLFAAAGGLAVILALVAGKIWYQFFRDTAPPAATIESAVEAIQRTPTSTSASLPATATAAPVSTVPTSPATPTSQPATAPASPTPSATEPAVEPTPEASTSTASLVGTWIIADIDEQFVGYRIGEELVTIGTTKAVGRTTVVEGRRTRVTNIKTNNGSVIDHDSMSRTTLFLSASTRTA